MAKDDAHVGGRNKETFGLSTIILDENGFAERASELFSQMPAGEQNYIVAIEVEYYSNVPGAYSQSSVLEAILQTIERCCSKLQLFARLGFMNYAALLTAPDRAAILNYVRECEAIVHELLPEHRLLLSYGIYEIKDYNIPVLFMLDCARYACSLVRGNYTDNVCVYGDKSVKRYMEDSTMCGEMERSLQRREFIAHYQPLYNLQTGTFVGAEALARWSRSDGRLIPPGRFIPLFERNGLIMKLDWYLMEQVCAFQREQLDAGETPVPIAVNFSRAHRMDADLVKRFSDIAGRYGLPCGLIEIEITESVADNMGNELRALLTEAHSRGISVSLDDFGTGVSSLAALRNLKFDKIKIDKSFLTDDYFAQKNRLLLELTLQFARESGMEVIVEGVETADQLCFLREIGCTLAQGYMFGKPMPADSFRRMLRSQYAQAEENDERSM